MSRSLRAFTKNSPGPLLTASALATWTARLGQRRLLTCEASGCRIKMALLLVSCHFDLGHVRFMYAGSVW